MLRKDWPSARGGRVIALDFLDSIARRAAAAAKKADLGNITALPGDMQAIPGRATASTTSSPTPC